MTVPNLEALATPKRRAEYAATVDKWLYAHDTLVEAEIATTEANIDAFETLLEQDA